MYSKVIVSPLELYLDPKNPRFITPDAGGTQDNIRNYLISQENVLPLARSIAESSGLMPGERIVVCWEDDKYIVLEGNRRTCACHMFIDRLLIPERFVNLFPATSDRLLAEINNVEVDIIPTRDEARRFLAVRHIERAKEWSTIAKMRFCNEDYVAGRSILEINDRTGLSISNINKYIRNYKILLRGINSNWEQSEREKLNLLDIEPDKLLRIFGLADTKRKLQLYFDTNHSLKSNRISNEDLDQIIHIWTKKAFIDNEMNTRTEFGEYIRTGDCTGACEFIKSILDRYPEAEIGSADGTDIQSSQDGTTLLPTSPTNSGGTILTEALSANQGQGTVGLQQSQQVGRQQGGPGILPFFGTLNWWNVDTAIQTNSGVVAVCKELFKISNSSTFIDNYPICTAFIIRALIEQTFKYHAKKNSYWRQISQDYNTSNQRGEPQLSFIIRQYKTNISTWIPDHNIRRLFNIVFNSNVQTEKLNLVVHSPESYLLNPSSLRAIPGEGLLEIANYLLS